MHSALLDLWTGTCTSPGAAAIREVFSTFGVFCKSGHRASSLFAAQQNMFGMSPDDLKKDLRGVLLPNHSCLLRLSIFFKHALGMSH